MQRVFLALVIGATAACGGGDEDLFHQNTPPTVDAGADQTVDEGSMVMLAPAVSDADDDAITVTWEQLSGPEVSLADAADDAMEFLAPEISATDGMAVLEFQVTAADSESSSTDTVSVTVNHINKAPVASIEEPTGKFRELTTISLSAGGSSDPDEDTLEFTWTQLAGPTVTIENANSAQMSFQAPKILGSDTLTFAVEVSDGSEVVQDSMDVVVHENTYVIYFGNFEGDGDDTALYLTSVDGSEPWKLLDVPVFDVPITNFSRVTFSNDRRYFSFLADTSSNAVADHALYIGDLATHTVVKAFDPAEEFGATADDDDRNGDGDINAGGWSPVANIYLFSAGQHVMGGVESDLYTYDVSSGTAQNLTALSPGLNRGGAPVERVSEFSWSPAGDKVAFSLVSDDRDAGTEFSRLHVIAADGSAAAYEVSDFDSEAAMSNASLYNNGRYLRNDNADVIRAGDDDATVSRGSELPDSDMNFDGIADGTVSSWAWSPSGEQLLYVGDTGPFSVSELHVVDADGMNHTKLTHIGSTLDPRGDIVTDSNGDGIAEGFVDIARWLPNSERLLVRAAKAMNRLAAPLWRDWVFDLAAGRESEVVPDATDPEIVTDRFVRWSPSGRYLLFKRSYRFGFGFAHRLYRWDNDTQMMSAVLPDQIEGLDINSLMWTADEKVMFVGVLPMKALELVVADPETAMAHSVLESLLVQPDWFSIAVSPTRDEFAYHFAEDPAEPVHELGVTSLTPGASLVSMASQNGLPVNRIQWSPDAETVVYSYRDEDAGFNGLSMFAADGSDSRADISGVPAAGLDGIHWFAVFGPPAEM